MSSSRSDPWSRIAQWCGLNSWQRKRLKQEYHLGPGVPDLPGQHSEIMSLMMMRVWGNLKVLLILVKSKPPYKWILCTGPRMHFCWVGGLAQTFRALGMKTLVTYCLDRGKRQNRRLKGARELDETKHLLAGTESALEWDEESWDETLLLNWLFSPSGTLPTFNSYREATVGGLWHLSLPWFILSRGS